MQKLITLIPLVMPICEYFDRETGAAWRIQSRLTNMGVWAANSLLRLQESADPDPRRVEDATKQVATILTWYEHLRESGVNLDIFDIDRSRNAIHKALGLDRKIDLHKEACDVARNKCRRARSAIRFEEYYKAAVNDLETQREEREARIEAIGIILNDRADTSRDHSNAWESNVYALETGLQEDQTYASRRLRITPLDPEMYDDSLVERQVEQLEETLALAVTACHTECDRRLTAALTSNAIDRFSGFKESLESAMSSLGIKQDLVKSDESLEAALNREARKMDKKDEELMARAETEAMKVTAPKPEKPGNKPGKTAKRVVKSFADMPQLAAA